MARRGMLLVLVLVAMFNWATVWGYPRPSPSPRGWQLDFKYGPMKQIRLVLPGESTPKTFWYLTYTVTNNTGRDVNFYPRSYLFTGTGQLTEAFQGVEALAYPVIAKLIGRELLEEELFVTGKLLQGEENARESVIIWRDFDTKAVSFELFISGLSGETSWVTDPMSGKKYPLVKTLQLSYGLGGDRYISDELTAQPKDHEWIMR